MSYCFSEHYVNVTEINVACFTFIVRENKLKLLDFLSIFLHMLIL